MAGRDGPRRVAITCQGGGSRAAFTAGVLQKLLSATEEADGRWRYEVAGLSGTSGGAICALLAWYGLLKDGKGNSGTATGKLNAFWHDIEPHSPVEHLLNLSGVEWSRLPVEWKLSPYEWPLSWMESFFAQWAYDSGKESVSGALPPWLKLPLELWWWRKDFVDLKAALEGQVDFGAIEALGALLQSYEDVAHWQRAHALAESPLGKLGKPTRPHPPKPLSVPDFVRRLEGADTANLPVVKAVIDRSDLRARLSEAAVVPDWEYGQDISDGEWRRWNALRNEVYKIAREIPLLFLGAVDVVSGSFQSFSSRRDQENGGITVDAALASAALPLIFKAVRREYWDGLFSQNPPIRNFFDDDDSAGSKPDEVWVVQLNPQRSVRLPTSHDGIYDRRNELSGNLSLNQEIDEIDDVNKWHAWHGLPTDSFKAVSVHRIAVDDEALERRWSMDAASKFDRSPAFLDALMEHGRQQATLFLPVRGFVEEVWNQPSQTPRDEAVARICTGGPALRDRVRDQVGIFHDFFSNSFQVTVDGIGFVHREGGDWRTPRRKPTWRAHGITSGGERWTLTGTVRFLVEKDRIADFAIEVCSVEKARRRPPVKGPVEEEHRGEVGVA